MDERLGKDLMQTRQMESRQEQGYEQREAGSPLRRVDSADRDRQEPSPTYTYTGEDPEQDARGLGWLSIGFGLAEVMAPHSLARFLEPKGWHCIGSRGLQRV